MKDGLGMQYNVSDTVQTLLDQGFLNQQQTQGGDPLLVPLDETRNIECQFWIQHAWLIYN